DGKIPSTVNEIDQGRPPSFGGERHALLIGQRLRQLPDQLHNTGRSASRRDPVRQPKDEGEPVWRRSADYDVVDDVL
ncbi:hypothetical protein U1Q18_010253, partial [Sarracenia purpurea var. burkii]